MAPTFPPPRGNGADNSRNTFASLPSEVFLKLIPYVRYTHTSILNLRLTCHRLNEVLESHESVLVPDIMNLQLEPMRLCLFPDLPVATYLDLQPLHARLHTLSDLHPTWVHISHDRGLSGPLSDDRMGHVYTAGLLLLYRLQDDTTPASISPSLSGTQKIALVQELPATSLACLYFTTFCFVSILRTYGPPPLHPSQSHGDGEALQNIEVACEELLLRHGPGHHQLRRKSPAYIRNPRGALEAEIATRRVSRQLHQPVRARLVTCLRRTFATRAPCPFYAVATKMWDILRGAEFDNLGEGLGKMARIVAGETL